MTEEEIIRLGEGTYSDPKLLDDGAWCCLGQMIYTTALIVDVERYGYGHRFCFHDRAAAKRALDQMKTSDDEPVGYIVRK